MSELHLIPLSRIRTSRAGASVCAGTAIILLIGVRSLSTTINAANASAGNGGFNRPRIYGQLSPALYLVLEAASIVFKGLRSSSGSLAMFAAMCRRHCGAAAMPATRTLCRYLQSTSNSPHIGLNFIKRFGEHDGAQ
jgi:hypothetical protein